MQFESWSEFLAMGGHAVYVWASFGISLFIISLNLVLPFFEHKKIQVSLNKKFQRENNRK